MTRRDLLLTACALAVGAAAAISYRAGRDPAAAQSQAAKAEKAETLVGFVVAPYLQYATATSVTVMWETAESGTSVVRYGIGGLTKTKEGEKDVHLHKVTLTDLEPGRAYVY
jgi:hypothetical protein